MIMKQSPTVLYLLDHAQPGGGETSFLVLMKTWLQANLPVTPVIIMPEDGPIRSELENMGLEVVLINYPRRTRYGIIPWWSFSAASLIMDTVVRLQPAIIHANNIFGMFYAGKAARKLGIPLVWTCHGWFDIDTRVKAWFARRNVTHISCVSESVFEEVTRRLGSIPDSSIDHLGIEPETGDVARETIRRDMNIDSNCTLIGVLGRFQKIKGHHLLLKALPTVTEKVPNLKTWFIGGALNIEEQARLRDLQEMARRDHAGNFIEFLGFRPDARKLLKALDALVIPSLAESFSMAALEGLDAGIPVVGPDGWGPREIIAPPRTGLRFNPGDAPDLAKKIIQVLLRKGESADFDPAAGPARVRKHFSVKAHLKRMTTLYHRLTEESCFLAKNTRPDKQRGCLFGLAIGDALGAAVEFKPPGSFPRVTGYRAGGPHGLNPGEWTDDTSMALALADSIANVGWDPEDQIRRYLAWYQGGTYSVNGICFDIGITVRKSLHHFLENGNWKTSSETAERSSGNGSIMRLAPVPIFYLNEFPDRIELLAKRAMESSIPTHASPQCLSACRYLAVILAGLMAGEPREEVLSEDWHGLQKLRMDEPIHPEIAEVAGGSFRKLQPPAIKGGGYVVKSLEAALWAFHGAEDFEDAVLAAVNLGDDADTTGAVCGQLAGAYWGQDAIPDVWLQHLAQRDTIEDMLSEMIRTDEIPST